jgi:hypothetical protein
LHEQKVNPTHAQSQPFSNSYQQEVTFGNLQSDPLLRVNQQDVSSIQFQSQPFLSSHQDKHPELLQFPSFPDLNQQEDSQAQLQTQSFSGPYQQEFPPPLLQSSSLSSPQIQDVVPEKVQSQLFHPPINQQEDLPIAAVNQLKTTSHHFTSSGSAPSRNVGEDRPKDYQKHPPEELLLPAKNPFNGEHTDSLITYTSNQPHLLQGPEIDSTNPYPEGQKHVLPPVYIPVHPVPPPEQEIFTLGMHHQVDQNQPTIKRVSKFYPVFLLFLHPVTLN